MRAATIAVLMSILLASAAWGQAPPDVRQVVRTSFPLGLTASAGLGFGATRQMDTTGVSFGTGSGWQARVDVQVPLGRTLGFEIGGQVGRQTTKQCARGACTVVAFPGHIWVYRGSGLLVWRFKPRAPVFFGVGPTLAYFSSNPVYLDAQPTTEIGVASVIGLDLAVAERIGLRVAWRSFFLVPKVVGPAQSSEARSIAWEQSLLFGARFKFVK